MSDMVLIDERISPTIKTVLGEKLNYSPFSSWYGKVKESLESSNEISETLFFQALEHLGAISRNGSQTLPPKDIYEVMKGRDGMNKNSWYCKKDSNIAGGYIESYGICLDEIEHFERKYLKSITNILSEIEAQMIEERKEACAELEHKKTKIRNKFRSAEISKEFRDKKLKRATKSFRGEMKEIREDIITTVFRENI